jgi:hypothetical protein
VYCLLDMITPLVHTHTATGETTWALLVAPGSLLEPIADSRQRSDQSG